jgi:hypothetical protein
MARELAYSSQGDDVAVVQMALNIRYDKDPFLKVDGDFGKDIQLKMI